MRVDCTCPRVRHQHGSAIAYTHDGCRCLPCRHAVLARQRDYRKRRHLAQSAGTSLTLPITGTTRRLQSLAALGWTCADLGQRLGITAKAVQQMQKPRGRARVRLVTARRIEALYDELSMSRPTPWRWMHTRCANDAARKGYPMPLSWDDDQIDDPTAEPHIPDGGSWDLKPCGTPAAARRHHRRGEPLCGACKNASRRQTAERKDVA